MRPASSKPRPGTGTRPRPQPRPGNPDPVLIPARPAEARQFAGLYPVLLTREGAAQARGWTARQGRWGWEWAAGPPLTPGCGNPPAGLAAIGAGTGSR